MIALLLLCTACVADPPGERFVCGSDTPCPAGFSCVESRCVSSGVDSGTDTGADTVTDTADSGPDVLVDSGVEDVGCVPSAEVCDGLDNDCDPDTPDGAEEEGNPCDLDGDGCANGVTRCEGGVTQCVGDGVGGELCNGRDDDCDGELDETDPRVGERCCAGTIVCTDDGELGCANRMVASSFDVCDGTDNDCDGAIDEFEPCECETVRNDFGTYLFCAEAPSAVVANNFCVGRGYHAVVIDGPDEQAVLSDLAIARGRSYLIGLTSALSGSFRWISGSDSTYRGWAEGQPGEEQCTLLSVDAEGRWVTGSCTAPAAYICEADGVPWSPPLIE